MDDGNAEAAEQERDLSGRSCQDRNVMARSEEIGAKAPSNEARAASDEYTHDARLDAGATESRHVLWRARL